MAAAAEALLFPFKASSIWGRRVSEDSRSICQIRSTPLKPPAASKRSSTKHLVCQAVADLQAQDFSDNGRPVLPFADPTPQTLSLGSPPSPTTETEGLSPEEIEKRWRRGNVDKKSARKWVRESIEWEATGMRTRGRADELLLELGRLRGGEGIDDVMREYEGRASVESLNSVVKGLGDSWQQSLALFEWMRASRFQQPNPYTYTIILTTLGRNRQVPAAQAVFDTMKGEGVERNIFHYNAMLACYSRSGLVSEALSLFQEMEERQLPLDAYTYSNMISTCVKGNFGLDKALQLFDRMERSGIKGDLVLYSSLLHACVKAGKVSEAERVREEMGKAGHSPNLYVYTEMIKLYAQAKDWRSAESMFYDMKRKKQKMDNALYTAMIVAYGRCGQYDEALSVFYDMRTAGYDPDVRTYSALVAACAAIGDYTEAGSIVEVMVNSGVTPNVFTYTSLIQAAGKAQKGEDISMLVGQMKEAEIIPTDITYRVIIEAFGRCKLYQELENTVTEMQGAGCKLDLFGYTTVVTAYAIAGQEEKLREWFGRVKENGLAPDLRLWTTFVYGLGKAGSYGEMMGALEEMKESGVQPNEATYTAVLDALFGGGQYDDVIQAFRDMEKAELRTDRATFKRLCRQLSLAHRAQRKAAQGVSEGGAAEERDSGGQPGGWSPEKLAAIEEYERAVQGLLKEIEEDDELDWQEEEEGDDDSEAVADVSRESDDVSRGVAGVSEEREGESKPVAEEEAESDLESEWVEMVASALKRETADGVGSSVLGGESTSAEAMERDPSTQVLDEASTRRLVEAEELVKGWDKEDEMGGSIELVEEGGGKEEDGKGGDEEWVWEDEEAYLEDAEEFETLEDFLEFDAEDLEADFDDDFDPNVDYRKLLKEKKGLPKAGDQS